MYVNRTSRTTVNTPGLLSDLAFSPKAAYLPGKAVGGDRSGCPAARRSDVHWSRQLMEEDGAFRFSAVFLPHACFPRPYQPPPTMTDVPRAPVRFMVYNPLLSIHGADIIAARWTMYLKHPT